MKKWLSLSFTLLVAVVMSCGLTACGDDDDMPGPSLIDGMLGNGDKGANGGGTDYSPFIGTWTMDGGEGDFVMVTIKSDGTLEYYELYNHGTAEDGCAGTWQVEGDIVYLTFDNGERVIYKFSVSGNTMKMWYYDEDEDEFDDEPEIWTRK